MSYAGQSWGSEVKVATLAQCGLWGNLPRFYAPLAKGTRMRVTPTVRNQLEGGEEGARTLGIVGWLDPWMGLLG